MGCRRQLRLVHPTFECDVVPKSQLELTEFADQTLLPRDPLKWCRKNFAFSLVLNAWANRQRCSKDYAVTQCHWALVRFKWSTKMAGSGCSPTERAWA